jgi:hypothetical protein
VLCWKHAPLSPAKPSPFDKLRVREWDSGDRIRLCFSLAVPDVPHPELVEGCGTTRSCRRSGSGHKLRQAESPPRAFSFPERILKERIMSLLLIIVLVIVLFGGGGGYYGYRTWGGPGLGGVLGLVLVILLILYLVGGFPAHY